jgi:hypothetical protein
VPFVKTRGRAVLQIWIGEKGPPWDDQGGRGGSASPKLERPALPGDLFHELCHGSQEGQSGLIQVTALELQMQNLEVRSEGI